MSVKSIASAPQTPLAESSVPNGEVVQPFFKTKSLAIRACAILAFAYMLSFLLRTVNSVISPSLIKEFGLSHSEIGVLTAAYFLSFGLMQVPLGVCLDRFGPRKTNVTLLFLAVAGCLAFAASQNVLTLTLSRALIGFGVSGCLMSAMVSFRMWFSPAMQAKLPSWMMMVGNFGAIASTTPVFLFTEQFGWRVLFVLCAVLFVVAAFKQWAFLPEHRPKLHQPEDLSVPIKRISAWKGVKILMAEPMIKGYMPLAFFGYGGIFAIQSLWIGFCLRDVWGLSKPDAANVLLLAGVLLMVAFLFQGVWAARLQRSGHRLFSAIMAGMILYVCVLLAMVFVPVNISGVWVLWIFLAISSTVLMLIQTEVVQIFPKEWAGRSSTLINAAIFLGAFTVQMTFGVAMDLLVRWLHLSSVDAFRVSLFIYTCLTGASVWFAYFKNKNKDEVTKEIIAERLSQKEQAS
jgi:MFS family permease